jgi:hypothetical protein
MALCFPYYHKVKPLDIVLEVVRLFYLMNEGTQRTLKEYEEFLKQISKVYNADISNYNLIPYVPGNYNIII